MKTLLVVLAALVIVPAASASYPTPYAAQGSDASLPSLDKSIRFVHERASGPCLVAGHGPMKHCSRAYGTPSQGRLDGQVLSGLQRLIAGLNSLNAYSNIHDATFPGGEIRGWITPTPEPGTLLLLGSGLVGIGAIWRKRRIP